MNNMFTAMLAAAAAKNPYKRRLAYLESTGTQYIELNHGFDPADAIEMEYMFQSVIADDKYPVAPKTWNNDRNRFAMPGCNLQKVVCGFGMSGTNYTKLLPETRFSDVVGEFYHATYSNRLFSFGTLECDVLAITWGSVTDNLRLFYGYNSPTAVCIAYYKHRSQNFSYDLVPVLDWNDRPAMYDTVSKQLFYNAGTGQFNYV